MSTGISVFDPSQMFLLEKIDYAAVIFLHYQDRLFTCPQNVAYMVAVLLGSGVTVQEMKFELRINVEFKLNLTRVDKTLPKTDVESCKHLTRRVSQQ